MSAYSELIKNFEKIRVYLRDFYVYGFKSRDGYDLKSARSYDDERRRIESWLGDHVDFVRTPEGKNVFLSIDSRTVQHNPLFTAWKTKSFTSGDITLHFILLDILADAGDGLSVPELIGRMDRDYLSGFSDPPVFDESTVRGKLREYEAEGIVRSEKQGRRTLWRLSPDTTAQPPRPLLDFFSEIMPCGVIGSFISDRTDDEDMPPVFNFKHHYITGTLDSDVLAVLFDAMQDGCAVSADNRQRGKGEESRVRLVPLRVFISAQSGRQHIIAYDPAANAIRSFRADYLSNVKKETSTPRFAELRARLDEIQAHMWGVTSRASMSGSGRPEHVAFTIRVLPGEQYVVDRLEREKRVGQVESLGGGLYRFSADVWDTSEMIPWIRTFICRIVQLDFSNRTLENRFRDDLARMYAMYGIGGGDET